ncbi:PAS domain-containing protein [Methylomonas sp. TEB]|uniref:PAS domain-containing protein n=1 Tax=Methylomonas sp. TEB TaxID=3398229 RepID=UPI0039F4B2B5
MPLKMLKRNLSEILSETLHLVIELAKADFGNIQIVDPNGHLRIFVHQNFPDWWIDYWHSVSAGQGACGTSIALGERVIVEDVAQSPIFVGTPALEIQLKAGVRAVQSTPVFNQAGQIIAMLSTHYRSPHRPNAKTQEMLDLFAAVVSAFIEQFQGEEQPVPKNSFRTVVEDQTEVISRFLPDGTFLFVNEVYCQLFGKTPQQLIGQRWHPGAHPDDLPMIETRLREMTSDNPVVIIENRVFVANAEIRWMQFVNRGFFDAAGILKEIQSVGRDITQLKQTELTLQESDERLHRAQAVARIGSFGMNCDTETFSMTQETARLFDLDNTGVTTFAEWFSRVHPGDQDKVETAWRAALQGAPYDLTYRIVVQGQIRWIRAHAELEFDGSGQLVKAIGTVQDISDIKQVELNLLESDERLDLALEGSGLVLWDWHIPERKVIAGNRWFELLGYTPEELGNDESDWLNLISPQDLEGFRQKLAAHLQGETVNFESEHRLRHKAGHWVYVEARGKVIRRDKDSSPLRMVGTILDITQRKRLNVEGSELLKRFESLIRESLSPSPGRLEKTNLADSLTKRQRQIVGMIAAGMTSAEIGNRLNLSKATVITHRRNLMATLDLHSTAEVTRFAIDHDLLIGK